MVALENQTKGTELKICLNVVTKVLTSKAYDKNRRCRNLAPAYRG